MKVWLVFEEYSVPYVGYEKCLIGVFSEEGLADALASEGGYSHPRSVEDWDVQGPDKLVAEYKKGYEDGYDSAWDNGCL